MQHSGAIFLLAGKGRLRKRHKRRYPRRKADKVKTFAKKAADGVANAKGGGKHCLEEEQLCEEEAEAVENAAEEAILAEEEILNEEAALDKEEADGEPFDE